MSRSELPTFWKVWLHTRVRELIISGWPRKFAEQFATRETMGRHRVAHVVGDQAACDAVLRIEFVNGRMRAFLCGSHGDLHDDNEELGPSS